MMRFAWGRVAARGVRVLAWLGWVGALAFSWASAAGEVNDQLDRGKGERSITYIADGSTNRAHPVLTFSASVVGQVQSSVISLAFVSPAAGNAARPRFSQCHGVEWIADGQAVAAGSAVYAGRMVDGDMVEWIDQQVSPQWAAALGVARQAHYRVCQDQYPLSADDLRALALIAVKLRNAALVGGLSREPPAIQVPAAQSVDYQGMNWRPRSR